MGGGGGGTVGGTTGEGVLSLFYRTKSASGDAE